MEIHVHVRMQNMYMYMYVACTIVCYSYMIAASGLWSIHEWLSSDRARGRSPSGLSKLKPRVYTP